MLEKPATSSPRHGDDGLFNVPVAPLEADALLVDFKNLGAHRKWVILFVLGTVASMAWYVGASRGATEWPSGASAPGLTFGIVAGLLILFEFLLWPRKTLFRVWRVGRTQVWMRAHIWLGLLTVPLIVLHSWRELGGGADDDACRTVCRRDCQRNLGAGRPAIPSATMLAQVPAETIYTQIGGVVEGFRQEARHLVNGVRGELSTESGAGRHGHRRCEFRGLGKCVCDDDRALFVEGVPPRQFRAGKRNPRGELFPRPAQSASPRSASDDRSAGNVLRAAAAIRAAERGCISGCTIGCGSICRCRRRWLC